MPLPEPLRASFRRHVRLACQVVREQDFRLIGALALDLSTKGILVRAWEPPVTGELIGGADAGPSSVKPRVNPRRVLTGEEVIVSVELPRSNDWLDAQGIVARVLHGRRPGDAGLSFGIELHGLSAHDERLLFEHLRGQRPPDALRPQRPLAVPAPGPRALTFAA